MFTAQRNGFADRRDSIRRARSFSFCPRVLDRVRATRFYLQPGEKGYRVELIIEREGWARQQHDREPGVAMPGARRVRKKHIARILNASRNRLPCRSGRSGRCAGVVPRDQAGAVDSRHALDRLHLQRFCEDAEDAGVGGDADSRRARCSCSCRRGMAATTGIIRSTSPIRGSVDPKAFATLIEQGHRLGFRFMPMFGTNTANRELPEFAKFADATTSQIDGDAFNLNWVDWDNDRHNEGWGPVHESGCRLLEKLASRTHRRDRSRPITPTPIFWTSLEAGKTTPKRICTKARDCSSKACAKNFRESWPAGKCRTTRSCRSCRCSTSFRRAAYPPAFQEVLPGVSALELAGARSRKQRSA